jgi:hypothetical protein
MATQLFFRSSFTDTLSRWSSGNNDAKLDGTASAWEVRNLRTVRGAGAVNNVTNTVAGATNGVEVATAGTAIPLCWVTAPLAADITISGSITWNLRVAESAAQANVAINGRIEKIDGATGAFTLIDQTARTTEIVGATEAANNFSETPAAGVLVKKGDRLRVRIFGDDAGTMGSGRTFTFWYNGGTAAATGDSYVTLTEDLTFVSEPAGTQVFLTDTSSAVSTASVDREAWTSRGAGVQTDVVNTVNGYTAPIQFTDTAGGTVVDWFTRPLAAFTLGGAARCNLRMVESNAAASAAASIEIARVAGDGTSPTVWAINNHNEEIATGELAWSFLASGADLAISDGQRIRIRVRIDDVGSDSAAALVTGHTVTLYYAGTSGGASGDTYVTFTQTLTEASSGTTATPGVAAVTASGVSQPGRGRGHRDRLRQRRHPGHCRPRQRRGHERRRHRPERRHQEHELDRCHDRSRPGWLGRHQGHGSRRCSYICGPGCNRLGRHCHHCHCRRRQRRCHGPGAQRTHRRGSGRGSLERGRRRHHRGRQGHVRRRRHDRRRLRGRGSRQGHARARQRVRNGPGRLDRCQGDHGHVHGRSDRPGRHDDIRRRHDGHGRCRQRRGDRARRRHGPGAGRHPGCRRGQRSRP